MGTEEGVQSLEGILGENNESSEVTTWSKLDDVKSSDVANVNTWEVSSGSLDFTVFITVDDEWSLSHDESRVSVLSLSVSHGLGSSDLGEIVTDSEVVKSRNERLGVWDVEGINNKR